MFCLTFSPTFKIGVAVIMTAFEATLNIFPPQKYNTAKMTTNVRDGLYIFEILLSWR